MYEKRINADQLEVEKGNTGNDNPAPPKEQPGIIAKILSLFGGNGSVHDVCT